MEQEIACNVDETLTLLQGVLLAKVVRTLNGEDGGEG